MNYSNEFQRSTAPKVSLNESLQYRTVNSEKKLARQSRSLPDFDIKGINKKTSNKFTAKRLWLEETFEPSVFAHKQSYVP